jgi:hypothetical protein
VSAAFEGLTPGALQALSNALGTGKLATPTATAVKRYVLADHATVAAGLGRLLGQNDDQCIQSTGMGFSGPQYSLGLDFLPGLSSDAKLQTQ